MDKMNEAKVNIEEYLTLQKDGTYDGTLEDHIAYVGNSEERRTEFIWGLDKLSKEFIKLARELSSYNHQNDTINKTLDTAASLIELECKEVDRLENEVEQLEMQSEYEAGDYWAWHDGDDLESFTVPILIQPEQLRELIDNALDSKRGTTAPDVSIVEPDVSIIDPPWFPPAEMMKRSDEVKITSTAKPGDPIMVVLPSGEVLFTPEEEYINPNENKTEGKSNFDTAMDGV